MNIAATHSRAGLLAAAIALTFAGSTFAGKHDAGSQVLTLGVQAPEPVTELATGSQAADGSLLAVYNPDFRARLAAPETMAREYLAAHGQQLGLGRSADADLVHTATRAAQALTVVRFGQAQDGVPVYGSDIAVTVAPDGRIIYVANASVRNLASVDTREVVSGKDALAGVQEYLGVGATRLNLVDKVIFQSTAGTHLAWQVTVQADGLAGTWQVLVDAHDGSVLRAEDTNLYHHHDGGARVDGTGWVFLPDPLSSTRSNYGDPGYTDANDADSPQLTAARVQVPLRDISFSGGNYSLAGPYAVCWEWEAPNDNDCPVQPSNVFDVTRNHLNFEAINGYYHLDRFMRYVNETLAVTAMPVRYAGGVRYDAHGANGADNAYYQPSTDAIVFGEGGVDDAEDADVLVHELGHAIHNWVTNGGLSQVQGLSEGTGDYLAMAYSHSLDEHLWTPADPQWYRVFKWDGHNQYWNGRITNYQMQTTYQSLPGSIHTAGQYWASCNREARDVIGGELMDRAFLVGLSMTASNTNQRDAAQAVINAAATLGYSQAQINAIAVAYNSGNTGGNTGCTYNVTVPQVSVEPVAQITPATISETLFEGESVDVLLSIGNLGQQALVWSITASTNACASAATLPWLSWSPGNGSVNQNDVDEVDVLLDAADLGEGLYQAHLCVQTNDADNAVHAIPVSLDVQFDDFIFAHDFECTSDLAECADPEVYESGPINHVLSATLNGTSIKWITGEIIDTDPQGWDMNLYNSGGLTAWWSFSPALNGGVAPTTGSSNLSVLDSGAIIGPGSTFSRGSGAMTDWRAGASGYIGFKFDCAALPEPPASNTCYGYVQFQTTAGTGYPATIISYAYNRVGNPITIP
ncbi:MAG: hypothetical protein M0Q42_10535 [Xanthomonadales bacterium]|nr:hypothetical protein [Xanthomonadales bacterium]